MSVVWRARARERESERERPRRRGIRRRKATQSRRRPQSLTACCSRPPQYRSGKAASLHRPGCLCPSRPSVRSRCRRVGVRRMIAALGRQRPNERPNSGWASLSHGVRSAPILQPMFDQSISCLDDHSGATLQTSTACDDVTPISSQSEGSAVLVIATASDGTVRRQD